MPPPIDPILILPFLSFSRVPIRQTTAPEKTKSRQRRPEAETEMNPHHRIEDRPKEIIPEQAPDRTQLPSGFWDQQNKTFLL